MSYIIKCRLPATLHVFSNVVLIERKMGFVCSAKTYVTEFFLFLLFPEYHAIFKIRKIKFWIELQKKLWKTWQNNFLYRLWRGKIDIFIRLIWLFYHKNANISNENTVIMFFTFCFHIKSFSFFTRHVFSLLRVQFR